MHIIYINYLIIKHKLIVDGLNQKRFIINLYFCSHYDEIAQITLLSLNIFCLWVFILDFGSYQILYGVLIVL